MWQYYNANPLGRKVSDCAVRAISLATEQTWDDTYIMLSEYGRQQGITFSEVEFINDFLSERYERYCPPRKTETVGDFVNLNLPGRWLITMRGHITCVIDGILYDTFDCSDNYTWCIYRVK